MKVFFSKKGSLMNLFNLFVFSILFSLCAGAQCSDEIVNLATGDDAIVFSYHSKAAGADCVSYDNSPTTQVTVSNDHNDQLWSRYLVKFNLAFNGLVAGDQISVSLDAEVISGKGRVEFNIDNTVNTAIGHKTFNTNGNYNATLTIPAGATNIDIWLFTNYALSTPGTVIYKNLSIAKLNLNPNPPSSSGNLALGKPAIQSSNWNNVLVASKAVDGNTDGSFDNGFLSCTALRQINWWEVDLGSETNISRIDIYNRVSGAEISNRLNGAKVYVGNSSTQNPSDYTEVATLTGSTTVQQYNVNATGRYVMVYLDKGESYTHLHMAEVEVYGSASDGSNDNDTSGGGSGQWLGDSNNITYSGNVGIGTSALSTYKLAVDGPVRSREVRVDGESWADYVFNADYPLPTLEEVEKYIAEKGHLINIPSADEVQANGILLGEMNKLLLEKIEELTLYILQQEKKQKLLQERVLLLEKQIQN